VFINTKTENRIVLVSIFLSLEIDWDLW